MFVQQRLGSHACWLHAQRGACALPARSLVFAVLGPRHADGAVLRICRLGFWCGSWRRGRCGSRGRRKQIFLATGSSLVSRPVAAGQHKLITGPISALFALQLLICQRLAPCLCRLLLGTLTQLLWRLGGQQWLGGPLNRGQHRRSHAALGADLCNQLRAG